MFTMASAKTFLQGKPECGSSTAVETAWLPPHDFSVDADHQVSAEDPLPAEVWLLTDGSLRGFHRLGLPMPRWEGSIAVLLPELTAREGWQGVRFLWADHGHWRYPTRWETVAAFAAALRPVSVPKETP